MQICSFNIKPRGFLFRIRDFDCENRSLAKFTLYIYRTPMRKDELFGDRQPQPAAALRPRTRSVATPEAVEDVGQVFGRDTCAGILHDDADSIWAGFGM